MARIGRWGGPRATKQDYPDGDGPAGLRDRHLLLLPTTVNPTEVAALVRSRVPDADLDRAGEARLGRHSRIHGPYRLSMEDAVDAAVPMPWTLAYAFDAPVEREDPAPADAADRDGLSTAFPDGAPWLEEGKALYLAIGLARRLQGAVRVSVTTATGRLIQPDPDRAVDLVIHAPVWLEPRAVHGMVARVVPGAELAIDGHEWAGPPQQDYSGGTDGDHLSAEEQLALHEQADEYDLAALAAEDVIDAYAIVGALGPNGMDGEVDVLVHVNVEGDPVVADQAWASQPFVTYEVRWASPDPDARESQTPSAEYVAHRERVRPIIAAVAQSLVEATGGVVSDEDGFPLSRYSL